MNSKHLEARIEILTDGSDKTGGAAVFLTIRRRFINHAECPDNYADTSTSQPSDGCDHVLSLYYVFMNRIAYQNEFMFTVVAAGLRRLELTSEQFELGALK